MKLAILLLTAAAALHPQELSHTTEPIVIHKTDPEYTQEALDAKIEGYVILSSIIGPDGVPSDRGPRTRNGTRRKGCRMFKAMAIQTRH
jgi:hypothetical protein